MEDAVSFLYVRRVKSHDTIPAELTTSALSKNAASRAAQSRCLEKRTSKDLGMTSLCGILFSLFLMSYVQSLPLQIPDIEIQDIWPFNVAPTDFDWISNWAAVGDSYAAGIGAGSAPKEAEDVRCSRYGSAYPLMLNDLMDNENAQMKFLACVGVKSTARLERELSWYRGC